MIPILKAQESIQRINELLYGTGNMQNGDAYMRSLNRAASALVDKSAAVNDFTRMTPAQRRAFVRSRFKVVE